MLGIGPIIWKTLRPTMDYVPPVKREVAARDVVRDVNGFPYSRAYYRRIDEAAEDIAFLMRNRRRQQLLDELQRLSRSPRRSPMRRS